MEPIGGKGRPASGSILCYGKKIMKDETKNRIESLSTEEMLYEINLGRLSQFQRKSFAHLKTCYQLRLAEEEKQLASEQTMAILKSKENNEKPVNTKIVFTKEAVQKIIAIVVGGLALALIYAIIYHYSGVQLK